jgi:hypothetical protein
MIRLNKSVSRTMMVLLVTFAAHFMVGQTLRNEPT